MDDSTQANNKGTDRLDGDDEAHGPCTVYRSITPIGCDKRAFYVLLAESEC